MLELRPTCEHCNRALPPESLDARIGKGEASLGKYPASAKVKHRPVDPEGHARFAAAIGSIPPDKR